MKGREVRVEGRGKRGESEVVLIQSGWKERINGAPDEKGQMRKVGWMFDSRKNKTGRKEG